MKQSKSVIRARNQRRRAKMAILRGDYKDPALVQELHELKRLEAGVKRITNRRGRQALLRHIVVRLDYLDGVSNGSSSSGTREAATINGGVR